MAIKLYELAAVDDARLFSPYCWRVRLSLSHKGLPFDCEPVRFTEKDKIAFSGQKLVPVLVDGAETVSDSWAIAEYLETAYPDRPSLFGGESGLGLARFATMWADQTILPGVMRLIVLDLWHHLAPGDQAYFRETREKRFGMTLEQFGADPDDHRKRLGKSLQPFRSLLGGQDFLHGAAPGYADYAAVSGFCWAAAVSEQTIVEADDPIAAWRDRVLSRRADAVASALRYAA
ncbi:glutathione S-transferase family protein [Oceanibacterium hippocampi]|uniref:Beta-etherase n=1 Tax=Oceanibacterium hippocampi TaxID=745714 RepID=A0A1Y5REX1_9PROT|nr:glutathione S-transferase family protein [Oceanibacterium hippocampi]SLN14963.1 Beta-etherase [Oceanibacterium hippocampi]